MQARAAANIVCGIRQSWTEYASDALSTRTPCLNIINTVKFLFDIRHLDHNIPDLPGNLVPCTRILLVFYYPCLVFFIIIISLEEMPIYLS